MRHSPSVGIDVETTRDALWRLRYAHDLSGNSLLHTAAVSATLKRSALPDTVSDRAFALGNLLADLVGAALLRARGRTTDSGPPVDGHRLAGTSAEVSPRARRHAHADMLAIDFATGDVTREALSAVQARFLSEDTAPVEELAERAGVARRTFERRLSRGVKLVTELLRAAEEQALRAVPAGEEADLEQDRAGATRAAERQARQGEPLLTQDAVREWADRAASWHQKLARGEALPKDDRAALSEWAHRSPQDTLSYRLSRIARLVGPQFLLDTEFAPLSLRSVPAGADSAGSADVRFGDLEEFLGAASATAVVLLGPPGSGKSTLLRRFELEAAVAGVAGLEAPLTIFAALGAYGPTGSERGPASPQAWLTQRWALLAPRMPPLDELMAEGGVVFLLDGLDELPQSVGGTSASTIWPWRDWIHIVAETSTASGRGNRAVFTCRTLDYTLPLSRPALQVPQAWLEPLDDQAARHLVRAHASANADARLAMLDQSTESERAVLRWPFFLRLFAEQAPGDEPRGAAAADLLSDAVRRVIVRELERGNAALSDDRLLTSHDRRRLLAGGRALPAEGSLLERLAAMGSGLHERATGSGGDGRGRAHRGDALELLARPSGALGDLEHDDAGRILGVAEALGLVDVDAERDEVYFVHQLFQEFFAARWARHDPSVLVERVGAEWRAADMEPGLAETLAALSASEPLPPLPATGWEEVAKMAVAMSDSAAPLVDSLSAVSLPLAGRAAAAAAVRVRLPDDLIADLARRLVQRSTDPTADLRARIAAGRALGELGDPRLVSGHGQDGDYLIGPLVSLPGRTTIIGEPEEGGDAPASGQSHHPQHLAEVGPFMMAMYPVTNAEWRAFHSSGGYDDPRWWPGQAAERWRNGEGTAHAVRGNVRQWWRRFRDKPPLLDEVLAAGQIDGKQHDEWQIRISLDEEALEGYLQENFPSGRCVQPRYWDDPQLGDRSQPVVGICWFEARAYVLWLAEQTSLPIRLPTEAEWEYAARGPEGRLYPYGGELDPALCNVRASRVRAPTPIGVYPGGESPEGITDLTGNVLEWTSSAVRRYPYDATDGRESQDEPPDVARILRGGSWISSYLDVRAAVRYPYFPDARDAIDGLRVVCDVS